MLTAVKIGEMTFEQFVVRVRQMMKESVQANLVEVPNGRGNEVKAVINHMLSSPGKGMRPFLVAMAGAVVDADLDNLLEVAAAVEMIHIASLVHDDIIDNSTLRRGEPALRAVLGDAVAVLAGDLLYAKAFQLLASLEQPEALCLLTKTVGLMCQGEIEQRQNLFNCDWREEEYIELVKKKTGALIACACHLGAVVAHAPREVRASLHSYGEYLGIAYQIADDILDWTVDSQVLGKPVGSDLSQGLITLPLILLLKTPFKEEVRNILTSLQQEKRKPDREEYDLLGQAMEYYNCLEESRKIAKTWSKRAVDSLAGLPAERAEILAYIARTEIFNVKSARIPEVKETPTS